jgi:2-polyprenyl-3-methyl-5-hydroxy-6-metoxy-1,4-benzoquinol methylase
VLSRRSPRQDARQAPAARLLTLAGAFTGVDRADWDTIVRAIVEHTAQPIGAAMMTASEQTTAAAEGPAWSAGASGWVEYWAGFAAPAREAVARAAVIQAGASVLDVGCGSGEFCELAAARGARVSGIDAAEGMVEFARHKLPGADLRVGPIEELPWPIAVAS